MSTNSGQAGALTILTRRQRVLARLFAGLLSVTVTLALVEGLSRWLNERPESLRALAPTSVPLDLQEYQMADPDRPGRYRLRPGYSATLQQLIAAKRRSGHVLGAQVLERSVTELALDPTAIELRVNAAGYKGPELGASPAHARILALGDSTTFGSLIDSHSYPRVMEQALRRSGTSVEVVNAGVEGYAPSDVLARMDELRGLTPDVTLVYIGWNALYRDDPRLERELRDIPFSSVLLVGRAQSALRRRFGGAEGRQQMALEAYTRPKQVDSGAAAVSRASKYVPPFLHEVRRIAQEMSSSGSVVVLLTLPGLYTSDDAPTPRALQIGHLPGFTDNPYVLAAVTERYNAEVRALASQLGLQVIDLERWSRSALQPRDQYFVDSVHLTERGQQLIGEYVAEQLHRGALPSS
jgi:lysophospholipase L1-like esterase